MTAKRLIVNAFIIALVCAGVAAVYYMPQWQQSRPTHVAGKGGKKGAAGTNPSDAVPVLATDARSADVPVYLNGVGTGRALNTVTVRAQVAGKIINISFTEGQDVPKGFILAKIDPATYQAQYDQAVAQVRDQLRRAPGFVAHAAGPMEGGYRVVEFWNSREELDRFLWEARRDRLRWPLAGCAAVGGP